MQNEQDLKKMCEFLDVYIYDKKGYHHFCNVTKIHEHIENKSTKSDSFSQEPIHNTIEVNCFSLLYVYSVFLSIVCRNTFHCGIVYIILQN